MSQRHTVDNALRHVVNSDDGEYGELLRHASLRLGFYKPRDVDLQQPHNQDEIYIVLQGTGIFNVDGQRRPFESGEALFVPAGTAHRFEDFSEDFCAWVVFYGPDGGEQS